MIPVSKIIRKNFVNIPGWKTKRRIVVIESDDWGSIRMPSRKVYELLLSKGIPVDKQYFLRNDCLESEQDLVALFEVLSSFKDKSGNCPVITANAIVANPDFEKIEAYGRKEYFFEPFTETYKRYPNNDKTFDIWKNEGIVNRLLWPQFHGREHINVKKWMNAINSTDQFELIGFDNKVILGLSRNDTKHRDFAYMEAFNYSSSADWDDLNNIAYEGLNIFEKIFGFSSRSFVAPCSVRGEHLDKALKSGGVLYHQCGQQYIPVDSDKLKVKDRFWGQQNDLGQIYWRRNSTFEPSRNQNFDWVDSCLSEMKIAFRWGKPAVINSHRVNFIGSLFPENRDNSLKSLKRLIQAALKEWPDIEFMTSDELGDIIFKDRK